MTTTRSRTTPSLLLITLIALATLMTGTVLIGCSQTLPPGTSTTKGTYTSTTTFDPATDVNAQQFHSEDELRAFLSNAQGSSGNYGIAYDGAARGGVMMDAVAKSTESGTTNSAAGTITSALAPTPSSAATSFSTTNNQVAGVDEADTTKTDGQYIYTITGNTIFIVTAGENASVIKTIQLKNAPSGMFIDGDRLAVFGSFYDLDYFRSIGYVPRNGMTYLTIYDISDRKDPKVVQEYKFEGNYLDGRMHDGSAYIVVTSSAQDSDHPTPLIVDGTAARYMPASDVYYYPIHYDSVQFATVHAIGLHQSDSIQSKAIAVQYGNNIYMSQKNLYITSTEYINEWEISQDVTMDLLEPQLTQKDRELIGKIQDTDNDVLSQQEKRSKILQVYYNYEMYMNDTERQDLQDNVDNETATRLAKYEALTYTVINRISTENGKIDVAATGKVPGTIANQFSLDENNDVLRVATTIQSGQFWHLPIMMEAGTTQQASADSAVAKNAAMIPARWMINGPDSVSNIYALDSGLRIIGNLSGIAPGEQIYSTRFIDNRLYMVTFRQVDPFFVIDLSDPTDIKLLGQLKVPGFSRYLHPYDGNTIIGIGQDATATGRQQGLKISLFDVTDVEHPKEVAKFVADQNSQSQAEWEHKAFLFDKEKQLLVIPAYSYNYDYKTGSGQTYNGAMVFRITPTEITMRGIIDHSQGQQNSWSPMVERSLWIGDLLYTKSPQLLRVNRISDLYGVRNVTLTLLGKDLIRVLSVMELYDMRSET